MAKNGTSGIFLTLLLGFAGAAAAMSVGLPAAALIGSSLVVFAASFFNLTSTIPSGFRTIAFTIIGCSLGSSLTRTFVDQAKHWPLSLLILTAAVITIMLACAWVLTKFYAQSAETAFLASAPGAMAYSLSITATGIGDARAIVIIQSIRLLAIIAVLPLLLDQFSDHAAVLQEGTAAEQLSVLEFFVIFLLSICVGWLLEKLRMPASYLLAGTLVSGVAHYPDLVSGRPSAELLFVGFATTGTVIGARFTRISKKDLKQLARASLTVVLVATSLAGIFSLAASLLLSLPFSQVYVAYAPGGVEAMAAMALSLGVDPAFVACHHLYRILLLFVLLPMFLKLRGNMRQDGID